MLISLGRNRWDVRFWPFGCSSPRKFVMSSASTAQRAPGEWIQFDRTGFGLRPVLSYTPNQSDGDRSHKTLKGKCSRVKHDCFPHSNNSKSCFGFQVEVLMVARISSQEWLAYLQLPFDLTSIRIEIIENDSSTSMSSPWFHLSCKESKDKRKFMLVLCSWLWGFFATYCR